MGTRLRLKIDDIENTDNYTRDLKLLILRPSISEAFTKYFDWHGAFKCLISVCVRFYRTDYNSKKYSSPFFKRWIHALNNKRINSQISNWIVTHKSSIHKMLSESIQDVSDQIADIENEWSYLRYNNIHLADVLLIKNNPQTGSSWIQTPPNIQKKFLC